MKRIIRTIFLLIAGCHVASHAGAQAVTRSTDTAKKTARVQPVVKPKGPKAISREVSAGLRLNSNGWSIFTDVGRIKSKDAKHSDMFYNVRLWQVEFTEKKHPKEHKLSGNGSNGSKNSYIYGKINNFYALKLGRGYMRMLAGKPDPGCVSIHWLNAGGVSLGMLKPYYLNVYSDPNAIKYGEGTREDFLSQSLIQSSAGFGKGLGEIKFIPGFHLKSAIHFDFSANRKNVIGIEAGVNAEYYTQEIPLMANQKPSTFFADVYVAFQYGRRW